MIALTFDDGPSQWTTPLLDLLAEVDAKATFFVCGWAIEGRENILRRMAFEGHEIGNHTFTHQRLTDLNVSKVRSELRLTSERIEQVTEVRPWLWRAPHFDHDEKIDRIAASLGLEHVDADVAPTDWVLPAGAIFLEMLQAQGDGEVIGLHDGIPPGGGSGADTREETIEAVRRLLSVTDTPFVTVSELMVPA